VPNVVTVPFCHTTPCSLPLASRQSPTIWPLLLIANGVHAGAVRLLGSGRLVMVQLPYSQGCAPVPLVLCEEAHEPTTWPQSLIPVASLHDPEESGASAPRSTVVFPVHNAACATPAVLVCDRPATSPDRLIAFPELPWSWPPRVPRSVIMPLLHKNACWGWNEHWVLLG
jgi:hypothetical protein